MKGGWGAICGVVCAVVSATCGSYLFAVSLYPLENAAFERWPWSLFYDGSGNGNGGAAKLVRLPLAAGSIADFETELPERARRCGVFVLCAAACWTCSLAMALTVLLKGKPRTHGSTTGRILLLVTIAWFVITLLCSDYGVDPEHHGLYCCISLVVFFTLFSCGTSLVWMSVSSISSMLKTGCRALSAVFLATLCVVGVCITFTVLSSNHSWKIGIHGSTFASSWPGCSIPVPSISWFDLMPSSFIVWLLKSGQCKPFSPSLSAHFVNNSYIIGQCPTPGKVNFIVFPPTEDVPPSAVNLRKLGCIQKWVLEHSFEGSQDTDSNGRFSLSLSGFNSSHFNSRRTISTVEVSCGGLNKQVLVQVQRDEERIEEICVSRESQRRQSVKPKLESLPSNVLVVFLDAIGRNSFMRNFPKTVALLDEPNLKTTEKDDDDYHLAFQFFRYHAVAPNTFLNARAMFTGRFDTGGTSLWKRFHDSGHVTALVDNSCWDWFYFYLRKDLNQSNDRDVAGTVRSGLDHHLLSAFCLPEYWPSGAKFPNFQGPFSMKERCIDGKSTHTLAFEYTTKFWETYSDVPKFAVTMLIEGHENTGHVAALMDQDLANLVSGKTLNLSDTAVFIVADHGLHMGPLFVLGLESADLENKLPVLIALLPQSFVHSNRRLEETLFSNEQALITAFDVHSTLSDFSLPEQEDSHPPNRPTTSLAADAYGTEQSSSLFRHIPASRTCDTAGIPQQFCKCVSP